METHVANGFHRTLCVWEQNAQEAKTKSGKTSAALAVREEVKEYLQKEKRQIDVPCD